MENLDRVAYSLIGEALRRPDSFGQMAAELKPEDFPEGLLRELWKGLCSLFFAAEPIDVLTLRHKLGGAEALDIPIAEALGSQCGDVAAYARILREGMIHKQLQYHGTALAYSESYEEAQAVLADISKLGAARAAAEVTDAQTAAHEFMDRLEGQRPRYIDTGFAELDKPLFLEAGDFVVIGGYPKAGKSMLAAQMARHLAETRRVGYFFLESNKRKLMDRIICSMSRVPLPKIKNRDLNSADWAAINRAVEDFSKLKFDIIDAAGMSVQDIQAISLNKRYEVIFVDYMQLLSAPGDNLYNQVTAISKGLHVMGQKHGITVFALAQLSRPEKTSGKPKPPNLSSFRESGQIEQDADAAMLLYPSDPNDNRSYRILNLAKNKEGEAVRLELDFDGAIQTFRPMNKRLSTAQAFKEGERRIKERQQQLGMFQELPGGREGLPF